MNIQTIQMDRWAARSAQREYAKQVRKHRATRLANAETDLARARLRRSAIEREDEALRKAYAALGRGVRVINLISVMRAAGLTETTRLPKLAVARADAQQVTIYASTGMGLRFSSPGIKADKSTSFPAPLAELVDWQWRCTNKLPDVSSVVALCPQIPPRHRPERPSEFYLLWEANWQKRPPDPDPFLLKPLDGPFFAIVAAWDMTPLEQSILEGRIGA